MSYLGKMTALVTGASGGIGSAVAKKLASDGYVVIVHYHSDEKTANDVCGEIIRSGGQAMTVRADISNPDDVRKMFAEAEHSFGSVDILVNNAGYDYFSLATDVTDEQWRKIIGIDLDGCFYCCREALRGMLRDHRGVIINISSMWGVTGASCEVPYSTAKAGMIGMTKALAKEYGPSGIRVNCIAPGLIDTKMNAALDSDAINELINETPCERIGTAEDVANAVSFLASDASSFITGQILGVNGGYII